MAVLGLAAYLTTFALDSGTTIGPVAAILAGLLAGVGLVPKQKSHFAVVAVLAVLGFLLVLSDVITVGAGNVDWPWYLLIAFTLLQAIAAVAALLLDADVITAPVPKPKYEQNPYGQYGAPGPYYGQPPGRTTVARTSRARSSAAATRSSSTAATRAVRRPVASPLRRRLSRRSRIRSSRAARRRLPRASRRSVSRRADRVAADAVVRNAATPTAGCAAIRPATVIISSGAHTHSARTRSCEERPS